MRRGYGIIYIETERIVHCMSPKDWTDYCMAKPGAEQSQPFGELPLVYKVCGKVFAEYYPKPGWYRITLKCDPLLAEMYRSQFPGVVVRGYHCPQVMWPYWNTVPLNGGVPEDMVKIMIDHSYSEVVKKLPKKQQAALGVIQ